MSEEDQAPQTQDEVKTEDPNATINIKVRFSRFRRTPVAPFQKQYRLYCKWY